MSGNFPTNFNPVFTQPLRPPVHTDIVPTIVPTPPVAPRPDRPDRPNRHERSHHHDRHSHRSKSRDSHRSKSRDSHRSESRDSHKDHHKDDHKDDHKDRHKDDHKEHHKNHYTNDHKENHTNVLPENNEKSGVMRRYMEELQTRFPTIYQQSPPEIKNTKMDITNELDGLTRGGKGEDEPSIILSTLPASTKSLPEKIMNFILLDDQIRQVSEKLKKYNEKKRKITHLRDQYEAEIIKEMERIEKDEITIGDGYISKVVTKRQIPMSKEYIYHTLQQRLKNSQVAEEITQSLHKRPEIKTTKIRRSRRKAQTAK